MFDRFSGRRLGLKPSRVKASPQWGLPPDQLIKQIKDGMEAAKEAIEQVTETLPRIQKVKHELANEWMADCITLLEQHSPLDRRMERDLGLPEELRSAHLPDSYREALEHLHGRGCLDPRRLKPPP